MDDFKMDGYEPIDEDTFEVSMAVFNKRNEVLRFYLDIKKNNVGKFNKDDYNHGYAMLDFGLMLMEKALYTEEADTPTDRRRG